MFTTKHVWHLLQHETASHLWFLSEARLYSHSSLMMPAWGLLQRKMAQKSTLKLRNVPHLIRTIATVQQTTATLVRHVTLESESSVFQNSRYLDSYTMYGEVKSPRLFIAQNVLK